MDVRTFAVVLLLVQMPAFLELTAASECRGYLGFDASSQRLCSLVTGYANRPRKHPGLPLRFGRSGKGVAFFLFWLRFQICFEARSLFKRRLWSERRRQIRLEPDGASPPLYSRPYSRRRSPGNSRLRPSPRRTQQPSHDGKQGMFEKSIPQKSYRATVFIKYFSMFTMRTGCSRCIPILDMVYELIFTAT